MARRIIVPLVDVFINVIEKARQQGKVSTEDEK
jgi:hypothetical protein